MTTNKAWDIGRIFALWSVAAALTLASRALAQTQWQGAPGMPGNWTDTANWVGGVVPTASAHVANDGIAVVNTTPVTIGSVQMKPGTLRIESGGEAHAHSVYLGSAVGSAGLLEVDGGSLLGTNAIGASLYVGWSAGSMGTVVMNNGDMTLDALRLGYEGAGRFTLSNGTVTVKASNTYLTGVAMGAGSSGEFIQDGGTFNHRNATLMLAGKGAYGRYVLNGGVANINQIYIGSAFANSHGGRAEVEINGGIFTGAVYVASAPNSTGTVVFTGTTNVLTQLRANCDNAAGGGTAATNSTASITFHNSVMTNLTLAGFPSRIGYGTNSRATILQNGGRTHWNGIILGYTAKATGTYTVTNNGILDFGSDTIVGHDGTGRLNVHGANVSTKLNSFQLCAGAGTGTVEMTAGSLTVTKFHMPTGTGPGYFYLKGGILKSAYKANESWQFYIGGDAGKGRGNFIQTGGTFLVDTNSQGCYLRRGLYEISGGTFASTNHGMSILNIPIAEAPVFRVKGSAPSVTVRWFAATTNAFLLQYVLDKSPEHLTHINFNWDRAYRCGHLRMGLDGGVVLSQTNVFNLMKWPWYTEIGYDFLSRPDTGMWTETLVGSVPKWSRITLASGYKQADLDMKSARTATFAARP